MLVELLILHYHQELFHSDVKHKTLSELRQRFRIQKARTCVKKIIKNQCFNCLKKQVKSFLILLMPDSPSSKVNFDCPFIHIGIDIGGYFKIKLFTDNDNDKVWNVLFTCLTVHAIHIEVITFMDTITFLNAFFRFVARRGTPSSILTALLVISLRLVEDLHVGTSLDFSR